MTGILGTIAVFLAIILSRPFTTLVHELGHALPALVFTKNPVSIYVGSYGNLDKSFHFNLGRLEVFFTPKLINLEQGLCSHQGAKTIGQSMMIVLGGPVFSLLLGLLFCWLILFYKDQPMIAFGMGIFLVSGIFDFIGNILPNKEPMIMHNGRMMYNDGYQFQRLLQTSKYPPSYFEAMEAINKNEYELGLKKLMETAESGITNGPLYQDLMQLLTHPRYPTSDPAQALAFHERFSGQFKLESGDYLQVGNLYLKNGDDYRAISNYSKAIELNYKNIEALYQRGKILQKVGYDKKALADFTKVVLFDEQYKEVQKLMNSF